MQAGEQLDMLVISQREGYPCKTVRNKPKGPFQSIFVTGPPDACSGHNGRWPRSALLALPGAGAKKLVRPRSEKDRQRPLFLFRVRRIERPSFLSPTEGRAADRPPARIRRNGKEPARSHPQGDGTSQSSGVINSHFHGDHHMGNVVFQGPRRDVHRA